ncbi:hypothetical protein CDD83_323 [Cordyceps sp. RAO-2017]|nr:hypothetical protein CDD83_323 [Cordyceps sp. RAO-2017]
MPSTVPLAAYLFGRLRQLGLGSVHGVPGDFNLALLDHLEPAGLRWVGNANELNAAYAADAYARVRGLAALVTTFGVGELSAVNAIAGAYSERAAVVHIVGVPSREAQDARLLLHHGLNDGDYRRFARVHALFTVAQTRLWDPRTGPRQIDDVLRQCLAASRPVYIEVPVDLVPLPVPDAALRLPIESCRRRDPLPPDPTRDTVVADVVARMRGAARPIILVDGEVRPMGIVDDVQRLVKRTGWPTWTSPFGKGLLDETAPGFHGVYRGAFADAAARTAFDEADLILCFGPHLSWSNTYGFSSVPRIEVTIFFTDAEVRLCGETFRDVPAQYIAPRLAEALEPSTMVSCKPCRALHMHQPIGTSNGRPPSPVSACASDDAPLVHDGLWTSLSCFLRPGDIVLGDTGTSGYGVREMRLPKHARLFTHVTWLSVGYMLPGAQGAALAQRELVESDDYFGIQDARTILFVGDGAFQMTAQELATIIRHELDVVVFLVNNDGYTVERCIHGRSQAYNDIPRWRYLQAPAFFGAAEDTFTASVKTWAELATVLADERLRDGKGLRMVELVLDREDVPKGPLSECLEAQKNA